jgi:hypothetical protein
MHVTPGEDVTITGCFVDFSGTDSSGSAVLPQGCGTVISRWQQNSLTVLRTVLVMLGDHTITVRQRATEDNKTAVRTLAEQNNPVELDV